MKTQPIVREVLRRECPAEKFHGAARECEPEAKTAQVVAGTNEGQEHLLDITAREPAALIFHIDANSDAGGVRVQPHSTARMREFKRILQQVRDR